MLIVNDAGREFFVRVVMCGDRYGRAECLTHAEQDPMIEFYDYTYADSGNVVTGPGFGPRGQFVSRYNAATLAVHAGGINLQGGVREWQVDADALRPVLAMAKRLASGRLPKHNPGRLARD